MIKNVKSQTVDIIACMLCIAEKTLLIISPRLREPVGIRSAEDDTWAVKFNQTGNETRNKRLPWHRRQSKNKKRRRYNPIFEQSFRWIALLVERILVHMWTGISCVCLSACRWTIISSPIHRDPIESILRPYHVSLIPITISLIPSLLYIFLFQIFPPLPPNVMANCTLTIPVSRVNCGYTVCDPVPPANTQTRLLQAASCQTPWPWLRGERGAAVCSDLTKPQLSPSPRPLEPIMPLPREPAKPGFGRAGGITPPVLRAPVLVLVQWSRGLADRRSCSCALSRPRSNASLFWIQILFCAFLILPGTNEPTKRVFHRFQYTRQAQ